MFVQIGGAVSEALTITTESIRAIIAWFSIWAFLRVIKVNWFDDDDTTG